MKVVDVLVACDTVECGCRIVELEGGRYAFVWGNVRARVGDTLPESLADAPDCHKGVEAFDSYAGAERAWRECALTLSQCGSGRAGEAMLASLPAPECLYCGAPVGDPNLVPAPDDAEGWEGVALKHEPGCEWVATRAHRIN